MAVEYSTYTSVNLCMHAQIAEQRARAKVGRDTGSHSSMHIYYTWVAELLLTLDVITRLTCMGTCNAKGEQG